MDITKVKGLVPKNREVEYICCCDCLPCRRDGDCSKCEQGKYPHGLNGSLCHEGNNSDWAVPFNDAISIIQKNGEKLRLDRERTAMLLLNVVNNNYAKFSDIRITMEAGLIIADALNEKLQDLLTAEGK